MQACSNRLEDLFTRDWVGEEESEGIIREVQVISDLQVKRAEQLLTSATEFRKLTA